MAKTFKVTQLRSMIGCTKSQVDTIRCLGLKGRHTEAVVTDTPANRGQIFKVQHLIKVEVVRG